MDFLDRLEWSDHDLEIADLAVVIEMNHVDAVDGDAVDLGPEFENDKPHCPSAS